MSSKDFSILNSDSHFVHPSKTNFSNFVRGSPKEHFCKIVLKLTHWPRRRCYLNVFFLFLVLMAVLFSGADPLRQFGRGSSKKHFCEILLKWAYWPWSRCCSTVFFFFLFFFLLWWSFCSAEQNHFSNFGRGSSKEHFCEIILKSTHWPWRRGRLKGFSIFSSDSHFVQPRGSILAILVEGHPRNICVK